MTLKKITQETALELVLNLEKYKNMDKIPFNELLLKTAFCCMASDGDIDNREISLIKSMCKKSSLFKDGSYQEKINILVSEINERGKKFILNYFDLLKGSSLSEEEELTLIDFAISTIRADELTEYAEIKFFKVIRLYLKINNDKILVRFPDIEQFLEEDIVTESYMEKITNRYLETAELPQFKFIE